MRTQGGGDGVSGARGQTCRDLQASLPEATGSCCLCYSPYDYLPELLLYPLAPSSHQSVSPAVACASPSLQGEQERRTGLPSRCKGLQGQGQDVGCKCCERPHRDLHSVLQVHHHLSQMSFSREQHVGQCSYSHDVQCPQPLATSSREPCVVACGTSRVIIYPPPVVVIFPGPIISTCPQETVVKSSPVLEGDAPAPLTSLRAEVPCSEPHTERLTPKDVPWVQTRAPRRTTYVFSSHWIHPCRRPSYRCHRPSESTREEHAPAKEKPETENTERTNEDKEL